MAAKIILKKSNVAAKAPAVVDLDYGELAINYTDGKLWYKNNSNIVKPIAGYASGTGLYQWTYTGKLFSVNTQETGPEGIFFKPDGLKMYVVGFSGDDINEYDLSVAWDISTAVFLRVSAIVGANFVTDLFFRADGLKVYITNANNGTVYEYDLGTAWNVSTIAAVRNVAFTAQDTAITGIRFKSDGLKMFLCGSTNDRVYEYTLSIAWDISSATFVQSLQMPTALVENIHVSADGLTLYVLTASPTRIYEYTLSSAWSLTTPTLIANTSAYVTESNPVGLFIEPAQNKAWIVGGTANAVYEISTVGSSYYLDTNNNKILGDTEFGKNIIVDGSLYVNTNAEVAGSLTAVTISNSTFTGSGNFTLSNTASTISLGTSQTTGTLLMGGTAQTGAITLGRSTAAQTLNIATGATLTATTKTVNLGTLGVSGSTTNINIGSAVSGALGTTVISSPTVTVSNALTVGTINKLTLTQPATGSTLTISDGRTISFPQSLSFPSTVGVANYVLKTDGAGLLSWTAQTGGAGGPTSWTRKIANYTAVTGDKLICDTSGGAFSITLPATPTVGDYVDITDGANWFTTNLTVLRNGSTIEGGADDVLLNIKGITVYFIYDGTTWQVTATLGKQGATGATGEAGEVTLAGVQTLTNKTLTGVKETKVAVTTDIDILAGNYFTKTISTNTTFTISNVPAAGTVASFILDLTNGATATITWWASIKWADGIPPTLTLTGRDTLAFFTHDGGTTWSGLLLGKDIK